MGYDLDPAYVALARERVRAVGLQRVGHGGVQQGECLAGVVEHGIAKQAVHEVKVILPIGG